MTIFELHFWGITLAPSYYGLMYVLAFLSWYFYIKRTNILTEPQLDTFFMYVFFWVILGWRLWYVLFYDFWYYLAHVTEVFSFWKWWMSFHGGFLWVVISVVLFCKRFWVSFWKLIDELAVIVPIGIFFWRIGNYLNKELLGFSGYYGWWAVQKNGVSYFPSPLLEAVWEWIVLCIFLYFINKYKKYDGVTSAYFLIGYGVIRALIEFFVRTPDPQIWYFFQYFSLWFLLCIPMIIFGIILLFMRKKYD